MEWLLFESRLMQSQGFLIKELRNQNLELFNFWMKFRIMNQSDPWMWFLHPWMKPSSMDDIHRWHFHPWMRFFHPCMECSSVTFCSHRLPILAKFTPKLCKTFTKFDRWQFHPQMTEWKCHLWMQVPHPWMISRSLYHFPIHIWISSVDTFIL